MVNRRKLGSMLQAGGNLGSLVSNLQTQSGDLSASNALSPITDEGTCLGSGGAWNKELGVCVGGDQSVTRPNLMNQKAKLLGE